MTTGAYDLLKRFGNSRMRVARALLDGQLEPHDEPYADELLSPSLVTAAALSRGASAAPTQEMLDTWMQTAVDRAKERDRAIETLRQLLAWAYDSRRPVNGGEVGTFIRTRHPEMKESDDD